MSPRERALELLADVDVPLGTLRRDPDGSTWLPTPVREASSVDDRVRDDVARFVESERLLRLDADVGADPLFTARVLQSLPERPAGTGLSPRQRLAILASSYAAAGLVGWLALGAFASETVAGWADAAHGWIEQTDAAPGAAMTMAALALVVVFAVLGRRTHLSLRPFGPELAAPSASRPDMPAM